MSTARLYIGFESYRDNYIEIGAVLVKNQEIHKTYHNFIKQKIRDEADYREHARWSHCIESSVIKYNGVVESEVKAHFLQWLRDIKFSPLIIVGHGYNASEEKLKNWLPEIASLTVTYEQVVFPCWAERFISDYHNATKLMKSVSSLQKCNRTSHAIPYELRYSDRDSYSKLIRYSFGFHCALFNCYQLAFFQKQLPLYQHEDQFLKCYCDDLFSYVDYDDENEAYFIV